jgi:hypothetical protein
MIVKFHARGTGRGSGPVDYLLGQYRQREGALLLRGSPADVVALIDSSDYTKRYTSGVLSFQEDDLPTEAKDKLMSSFEKALLPGLDADQYACLWVEHQDKGRLELNFLVPNVELQSGKRLQPWFAPADKPRIDAWKTVVNTQLGLHDPDSPLNKRALCTPRNLPASKLAAAQAITDGLLSLAASGELRQRDDVIRTLEEAGFTVARETKNSISIADPEGGRNIRLKGMLYERDFRFGEELRGEIEAAGERYRCSVEARVQAARGIYQRGVELKRAENHHRHKRAESVYAAPDPQDMALGGREPDNVPEPRVGRSVVSGERDRRERGEVERAEAGISGIRGENVGREPDGGQRRPVYRVAERGERENGLDGGQRDAGSREDSALRGHNDRAGNTIIERVRAAAERVRAALSGLGKRLRRTAADVRHHEAGERAGASGDKILKQSGVELERAAPAVEHAVRSEQAMKIEREKVLELSRAKSRQYHGPTL